MVSFSAGQSIVQVATGWAVFQDTGSALRTGLVLSCFQLPRLIFGLHAGAIVDRIPTRRILAVANISTMIAILLTIAARIYLPQLNVFSAALLLLILGAAQSFRISAVQVMAFSLGARGEEYRKMGVVNLLMMLAQGCGAIAAGALLSNLGPPGTFLVAAIMIGGTLFLLAILEGPSSPSSRMERPRATLLDTLDLVRTSKVVQVVTVVTVIAEVFCASALGLFPVVADVQLKAGSTGLGFLQSMWSLGGLIALQLLAVVSISNKQGTAFLLASIILSGGTILLSFTTALPVAMFAVALSGACIGILDTLGQFLLQRAAPPDRRGAAMGIWLFCVGCGVIGAAASSLAAGWLSASVVIGLNATVALLLFLLIAARSRRLIERLR